MKEQFPAAFTPSGSEAGPAPSIDREMVRGFGLAAMIMTLQASSSDVHCLKGNHDNVLNSQERGNRQVKKQLSRPGEGEITRVWTLARFGAGLAGKYATWENHLPLLAIFDNEEGLRFVASHTEPGGPYTREEIERREDDLVFGLTWTRNGGRFAPDVLRNIFGSRWTGARYFASHTATEEGVLRVPDNKLVIVNKPHHLVAALVRPGFEEFEVHTVAES